MSKAKLLNYIPSIRTLKEKFWAAQLAGIDLQSNNPPWKETDFNDILQQSTYIVLGAISESEKLLGFLVAERPIESCTHIVNLGVAIECRRKGIAKKLVTHILQSAVTPPLHEITLEVRASNHAALELYKAFKFNQIDVRKAFYKDPTEDALVLKCDL